MIFHITNGRRSTQLSLWGIIFHLVVVWIFAICKCVCFQDAKGCKRAFSGSRGTGKSRHEGVQGGWAVRQTSHLTRFNWTTRAGRRFRRGLIDTGKKLNTSLVVVVQNSRFPDESLRSHVGHTGPKWWHKSFSWGGFACCTFLYLATVAKPRLF